MEIPRRPLLPAERLSDRPSSSPRAVRGRPASRTPLRGAACPASRPPHRVDSTGGHGKPRAPSVARERPRAAARRPSRGHPLARRQPRAGAFRHRREDSPELCPSGRDLRGRGAQPHPRSAPRDERRRRRSARRSGAPWTQAHDAAVEDREARNRTGGRHDGASAGSPRVARAIGGGVTRGEPPERGRPRAPPVGKRHRSSSKIPRFRHAGRATAATIGKTHHPGAGTLVALRPNVFANANPKRKGSHASNNRSDEAQ